MDDLSNKSETDSENKLDEHAFRNKITESKTTETNKTVGNTNEATIVKPKSVNETVVTKSKINRDEVIIEEPSVSTDRPSINTARPVNTASLSINTARPVNTSSPSISTARPVYASRPIYPRMDNVRPRGSYSPIKRSYYTKPAFRPKDLKQDVKTFGVKHMTSAGIRAVVNTEILLKDHAVVDSGCSSHMTSNKAYLLNYEDFNGDFVAFGSDPKGVKYGFKLLDESQVVLRAPRKDDVYNLDLKNIVPSRCSQEKISNLLMNTLLPLQPHRTRIPVEDVPPTAHEKPSKSSPKDNDIQDSEDAANKESEQDLQDELEMMITQELAAKAMDDISRQAFKEEKRRIASQKKATQATSTNKLSTDRPSVSTDRPFVSTNRSNSAASTPTGANAGESSFVYLGGKIPIDASTLPNADLPIDPNMSELEDSSDTLSNDGIFNRAYDDNEDVGAVADFNNMDNTIAVSLIPSHSESLRIIQKDKWGEAIQEELLQFKLQKVWVLVDLPFEKKVISTKWVFRNKKDERSIVVKNKACFCTQVLDQRKVYYDVVFGSCARIEAIRYCEESMHKRIPMSSIGVNTHSFWNFQVKQQLEFFISRIIVPDSIPEGSGGNHEGRSSNDASLSGNEDGSSQETKERSQTTYHTSQSLDEDKIGKEDFSEEKGGTQGVYEGRTSSVVLKEKESANKEVSTEAPEGTDKKNEGTDKKDGGTDSIKVSTDRQGEGTGEENEGKNATQTAPTLTSTPTPTTPTPTVFGDDETIAQVLIIISQNKEKLKEKEKGVELRDLANDEEVAKKVQEEWEAEEEKKRLAKEEATKAALSNEYDFIQARLNADKILAEKLQEE
ncbi:putative ribonuclease H-like domain-containing protein [Tanacetum coccineum]